MTWQDEYDVALKAPPTEGMILTANDPTKMVKLHVGLTEGNPPFLYCLIYLPCIVGRTVKWVCRDMEDQALFGWKGILMPKARELVIRKHGVSKPAIPVKSVRVVKVGEKADCVLVEVCEL